MIENIELVLAILATVLSITFLVLIAKISKRFSKCERKIHDV